LRERREDIALLASHFLKKYATAAQKSIVRINEESLAALRELDWPGNVRELENTIERAVAMGTGEELRVETETEYPLLSAAVTAENNLHDVPATGMDFEEYVADVERSLVESALQQSGGVQVRAAELLRVSYRSFRHLVKKHHLQA